MRASVCLQVGTLSVLSTEKSTIAFSMGDERYLDIFQRTIAATPTGFEYDWAR